MKRSDKKFVLGILLAVSLIFLLGFLFAISYNVAPSTAGNGTNASLLIFNVSNAGTTNNVLTSITVNLIGTASSGNISNVTLIQGANVYFNTSGVSFPLVIPISATITAATNFTLNYTLSSSATDNFTFGANITAISAGANVTFDTLPYTSGLTTISASAPSVTGLTNNSNLSQTFISLNISTTKISSNISWISISLYNSSVLNSTFLVNSTTNSSVNQKSVIQSMNTIGLPNGIYYANIFTNDTTNNIFNQTFVITLDTVAPVVGGSCYPLMVSPGQTVTCSCSATGGYNSSTLTNSSIITVVGPGTYSYGCSATDFAGNIGTGSANYYGLGYPGPGITPASTTPTNVKPANNTNITTNPSAPSAPEGFNLITAIINFFKNLFKAIFG